MKKIKYRQYYYDGDYSNEELNVPDECNLYEICFINISHVVKDMKEGTRTTAYVLLCPSKIDENSDEECELIGNVYLRTLDDIFITDSEIPIKDVESAPKFNEVYGITRQTDPETKAELFHYISKVGKLCEASKEDVLEISKLYEKIETISSIFKLRKLTRTGIEVSNIQFKDSYGKNLDHMAIIEIEYRIITGKEFSTDPSIAKLFFQRAEESYKNIIESE